MRKPAKPNIEQRSTARRCAIYTRKSSEEGLDQAFNSLDAQREACEAYIRSQRHEGWVPLPTLYDDGGISGGTLERPALQQLLADIAARKVDLVVVYKVDRLTRSLSDFAKIVDVFDANGASFVSVTQQFNTSTSMGRLTLNMLLSFAQFEREVTGERIRDKIAASKRKGMWMGGNVALGYDVRDRRLVINRAEADTVRHVFTTYLNLGSVRLVKEQLTAEGVTSKVRAHCASSKSRGGCTFSRGALYLMLQNRLYRGELHHQGKFYPGEHTPIVDSQLWDAVQSQLAEHRNQRMASTRSAHPSQLAGLVYDHQGERLIPTHASKSHRRYRYYVSKSLQVESGSSSGDGLRIPATDLEQIVTDRLLRFLREPTEVLAAIHGLLTDGNAQRLMLERAAQVAMTWTRLSAAEQRVRLRALVSRISVQPDRVDTHLLSTGLTSLLAPGSALGTNTESDPTFTILTAPAQLMRWKKEVRLLVRGPSGATEPNPALIRLIARAHALGSALLRDRITITDLAKREGVTSPYITKLVRLTCLAPDITTAIIDGQQPAGFTAEKLMADSRLPLAWSEQRQLLGFS
jgi:site-specific DNA recombinase